MVFDELEMFILRKWEAVDNPKDQVGCCSQTCRFRHGDNTDYIAPMQPYF